MGQPDPICRHPLLLWGPVLGTLELPVAWHLAHLLTREVAEPYLGITEKLSFHLDTSRSNNTKTWSKTSLWKNSLENRNYLNACEYTNCQNQQDWLLFPFPWMIPCCVMEEQAPECQRDLGVKLSVPPKCWVNSASCIFSKLWFPDLQNEDVVWVPYSMFLSLK